MAKKKIAVETPEGASERERRQAHVDAYALSNPVKYEQKKEALEKWVNEV